MYLEERVQQVEAENAKLSLELIRVEKRFNALRDNLAFTIQKMTDLSKLVEGLTRVQSNKETGSSD